MTCAHDGWWCTYIAAGIADWPLLSRPKTQRLSPCSNKIGRVRERCTGTPSFLNNSNLSSNTRSAPQGKKTLRTLPRSSVSDPLLCLATPSPPRPTPRPKLLRLFPGVGCAPCPMCGATSINPTYRIFLSYPASSHTRCCSASAAGKPLPVRRLPTPSPLPTPFGRRYPPPPPRPLLVIVRRCSSLEYGAADGYCNVAMTCHST